MQIWHRCLLRLLLTRPNRLRLLAEAASYPLL